MKMKEIGRGLVPGVPLDPPMLFYFQIELNTIKLNLPSIDLHTPLID